MRTEFDYVDYGCGFPVVIDKVAFAKMGPDEVGLINHALLEDKVVEQLVRSPGRLTGDQVRFLRLHFEIALADFGKLFGVSHVAVKKWEEKRDDSTRMSWPTEKDIRLFAFRQLNPSSKAFMALYEELRHVQEGGQECIRVSLVDSKGGSGAAGRPRLVRIGGARKAAARQIS